MPIAQPTFVDGVLINAATLNAVPSGVTELQAAGILLDLTSTAQCNSTGAAVAVAGLTGSVTLTSNRRIMFLLNGTVAGSAIGNLVDVTVLLGTAAGVGATNYISATASNGATDCNRVGLAYVMTAGTYTASGSVARRGTAGTGSLYVGARFQVIDIGAA